SSNARRICFSASEMFSSVRTACPRRDLKARWSFSWRFSNMRNQHYFSRREARGRLRAASQSLLLHLRPHHFKALGGSRVLQSAHAPDQIERVPVEAAFFYLPIADVNRDDF